MLGDFVLFVAVGFAAQLVDGAIGMAYGLSATTVMLSFGIPPATASASVHAAEVFTTGISGFSHWRFGNVDWAFVSQAGAAGHGRRRDRRLSADHDPGRHDRAVHERLSPGDGRLDPAGRRSAQRPTVSEPPRWIAPLGFGGGFLDAIGGGGWGPMVTSTLLGHGTTPRFTIGSVNFTEFFVTATISVTFLGTIGLELWPIIAGLILGGALAAPLAAYAAYQDPRPALMILVGSVIVLLSIRGLIQALT